MNYEPYSNDRKWMEREGEPCRHCLAPFLEHHNGSCPMEETTTKVNNYECGIYQDGEVFIQTEPHQMQANGGKVYLTVRELNRLLAMVVTDGLTRRIDARRNDTCECGRINCSYPECQAACQGHRDDGRGRCIDCDTFLGP